MYRVAVSDIGSGCGLVIASPVNAFADGLATILAANRNLVGPVLDTQTTVPTTLYIFDGSSSHAVRTLRVNEPRVHLQHSVVLGLFESIEDVCWCASAGVPGLVARDAPIGEIAAALSAIAGGGVYFSSSVSVAIAQYAASIDASKNRESALLLTARESDVVKLLRLQRSNREIAAALGVSEQTVKVHVRHILAKLHVTSRRDISGATVSERESSRSEKDERI
jgi:DNA-binding NarL/FixJ family response regulator